VIEEYLKKVEEKKDLSEHETEEVFTAIMKGSLEKEAIASFLLSLKAKGETVEEITSASRVMRKFATKIDCKKKHIVDTCGTGGDGADTFNISTISAFVACGAGCTVAKHGNKAVSSKCGSADLLEALEVNINVNKSVVERCVDEIGIGFLFAPKLHLAMKHAMPARRMIKTRSIFNILGPLTNPADAKYQLLGVYDRSLVETLAHVLKNLGSKKAMVVHGKDGLDEITTTSETYVSELKNGRVENYTIKPEDFGFARSKKKELKGGGIKSSKRTAEEILSGKKGKKRDIVLLNAGAAIYVSGLAVELKTGIEKAKESIDSGNAFKKLQDLVKLTNS